MKVLYSHFGILKKGGWGRTFLQARSLAKLGNDVTLITSSANNSIFISRQLIDNVNIIAFPDILPKSILIRGYGLLSLLLKIIHSSFNRYDLIISDAGHRPSSGWPCLVNRFFYNGIYISEWWDHFGEGGYLDDKGFFFRIILGGFEKYSEIANKKNADFIIVLSEYMQTRALKLGIPSNKLEIIHGGSLTDILIPVYKSDNINSRNLFHQITFGYIGMSDGEIEDLLPFLKAITNDRFKGKIKLNTYGRKISKKTITELNLQDIIVEKGWIDYFVNANLLDDVDIFVMVKKITIKALAGWPNKFGDYLALGKPVLITPYGDLVNFIEKYNPGVFVVEFDEKSIINKIDLILNSVRYNEYLSLAKRNRNIAEKFLDWDYNAVRINDIYSKLIE